MASLSRRRRAPTRPGEQAQLEEAVRHNLVEEYRNHFHITVSIFKGITLGAAAYSLLAILGATGSLSPRVQFTAVAFWLASFSMMIVTYNAMMFHSLLTVAALNMVDVLTPFVFAIGEFSLFPILAPVTVAGNAYQSTAQALKHLSWWPLGLATMALIGTLYMGNAQSSLSATIEALPPRLEPYLSRCKATMHRDQMGLVGSLAFNAVAFLLIRYGFPGLSVLRWLPSATDLRQWEGVLGVIVIANGCQSLWTFEKVRRELADVLTQPGDEG